MLSSTVASRRLVSRAFSYAQQQQQQHLARRWASIVVVSESDTPAILPATQSAVTAATQLKDASDTIILVTAGTQGPPSQIPQGVDQVIHCETQADHVTVETWAQAVQQVLPEDAKYVLGTSTKLGSSVIPRTAALVNVSPLSDVLQIHGKDKFVRPMYAGNALATVQTQPDTLQVMTIRPTSFEKAPLVDAANVTTQSITDYEHSQFVSANVSSSDGGRPDLTAASTVVSGGRGMKDGSNFGMLEDLVDALGGGAVGASRAAVDAGMISNDKQVGQTGKVVAPDLYVAVGISGAIQHLSGMKDSKTIVAINQDTDAPIFQVADYGLEADLFTAVPEMTQKVKE